MHIKSLLIKKNYSKIEIVLIIISVSVNLFSQSLEIFNIDFEEYPVIKANFKAIDSLNNPYFDITKKHIKIYENDDEREILYLKTPEKYPEPLSVILAFDISGSMDGDRLQTAKEAANTFINEISGSKYELAITTFNNSSYINSDFTNDLKRLKKVVDGLNSFGGTKYDSAFMQPQTGIFRLAQKAQFKKVVIFMTDGLSKANTDTIISTALKENILIYCTAIKLPMPEILKDISRFTGGDYYSEVNDPRKASEIYKDIYNEIVASDYGTIKWQAAKICDRERFVSLKIKNLSSTSNYSLINRIEKNFEIKPRSFFIGAGNIGREISRSFLLRANNRPVIIKNITTDSPDIIKIEQLDSALILLPDENSNIRFFCSVNDTIKSRAKIFIEAEDCIENSHIDIFFGQKGNIEVTNPKYGDIYAVGTDIDIKWKGISKDENVALYYRRNNNAWKRIGQGSKLHYCWIAPKDTGKNYTIKVQALDGFEKSETIQLNDQHGFTDLYDISGDGSLAVYKNRAGYKKIVHIESGTILKVFQSPGVQFIFFSRDNKNLISIYKNSTGIQNIYNDEPELFVTSGEQGFLFSSNNSNTGDEYLMSAQVDPYMYPGEKTKLIDYTTNETFLIKTGKTKIKYAGITNNGNTIIALDKENTLMYSNKNSFRKINQINPGYKKIIVSPSGEYCFLKYPLYSEIIKTKNGKTILHTSNDTYFRFSPDGNKLMTVDSTLHINIWDMDKENKILQIPVSKRCNFSLSGKYLHYYFNNIVHIYDFEKEKYIVKQYLPNVSDIKINLNDQEYLVVRNAICEVYDLSTSDLNSKIKTSSYGGILSAYFDVNSNVLIHSASIVSLWEPKLAYNPGISDQFEIVSPQPDILSGFNLGKQEILTRREEIIPKIVKNNSDFPIKIESVDIEEENSVFEIVSGYNSYILLPGQSNDIELGFTPDKVGFASTNIIVSTPDTSYICHVTGEGINKITEIPGKIIDFGRILINTRKDTSVILLKNISDHMIEIEKAINYGPDKEQFGIETNITHISLKSGESLKADLFYNAIYDGISSGVIMLKIKEMQQPVSIQLIGEAIPPQKIKIYGHTFRSKDSTFIEANVLCTDLQNNKVIFNEKTNYLGYYEFTTYPGINYLIYAEKDGFISGSENINLTNFTFTDSIERNIYLSELQKGSTFRLNGVFFEFAKTELLKSSVTDLERVLQILITNPEINLEIHGHTDYIGSDESNMILSSKRADAIKKYLIQKGVDQNRLNIKFFGESKPIADNQTEEGRQLNRRVEFVIVE